MGVGWAGTGRAGLSWAGLAGPGWVGCAEADVREDSTLREGRVSDAVLSDIEGGRLTLSDWQVLLGGGPGMVWGTVEGLLPAGLRQAQCQADAFSYAPRTVAWPDAL